MSPCTMLKTKFAEYSPSISLDIRSSASPYMLILYWALRLWKSSPKPASESSPSSGGFLVFLGRLLTVAGGFLQATTAAATTIPTMRSTAAAVRPIIIRVRPLLLEPEPDSSGLSPPDSAKHICHSVVRSQILLAGICG